MSYRPSDSPQNNHNPGIIKPWLYFGSGVYSADYNMDRDRYLLRQVQSGEISKPVLRLYRWEKPTVSFGRNQDASDVLNMEEVTARGYGLVQRPTGGRALLHKGDLCYAFAARRSWHPSFRSLSATYRAVSMAIRSFLRSLGVDQTESTSLGRSQRNLLTPCFAMTSPYEIMVRGNKICGNAQFRTGGSFLQHGSIRVFDSWDLRDLQAIWPQDVTVDLTSVTCLEKELVKVPEDIVLDRELVAAFCRGFQSEIETSDFE